MAQITQATYQALPAVTDDDRWSVPHTAMLVTLTSSGLWALILYGLRCLFGS